MRWIQKEKKDLLGKIKTLEEASKASAAMNSHDGGGLSSNKLVKKLERDLKNSEKRHDSV